MSYREDRSCRAVARLILRGSVCVNLRRGDVPRLTVVATDAKHAEQVSTRWDADALEITGESGTTIVIGRGTRVVASGGSIACAGDLHISHDGRVHQHIRGSVHAVVGGDIYVDGKRVDPDQKGAIVAAPGPLRVELELPAIPAVVLRGSGDLRIDDVSQDGLHVSLIGSGDVDVAGRATHFTIELSGSGEVDARDLQAENAEVSLVGSGDVHVFATAAIRCMLLGSGDIVVHGNPPKRSDRVSGSGDIRYRPK